MSYDESGWKKKLVNGLTLLVMAPIYPFKKMMDYSKAFEEEAKE